MESTGVHMESTGVHMESTGVHMESTGVHWSPLDSGGDSKVLVPGPNNVTHRLGTKVCFFKLLFILSSLLKFICVLYRFIHAITTGHNSDTCYVHHHRPRGADAGQQGPTRQVPGPNDATRRLGTKVCLFLLLFYQVYLHLYVYY
jgi:hypothetical protein